MTASKKSARQPNEDRLNESDDLTMGYDFIHEKNASSLFYFLMDGAFACLLPFLPVFLLKKGFIISQIGTIMGITFMASAVFSPMWHRISLRLGMKKYLMMFSILSWILFLLPLGFISFQDLPRHCPLVTYDGTNVKVSYNQTDLTKREAYILPLESVTRNPTEEQQMNPYQKMLLTWSDLQLPLLVYICVFAVGRVFQSGTDYFYVRHQFSLRIESEYHKTIGVYLREGSSNSLAAVTGAFLAICLGVVVDHVPECDKYFGHFRCCFYVWAMMLAFAALFLHFQELPNLVSDFTNQPGKRENGSYTNRKLRVLTMSSLCLMFGSLKGLSLTYLCLQLNFSQGNFAVIGAAYAAERFSEVMFFSLKCSVFRGVTFIQAGLIVACIEFFRNIFFSFVTTRFMTWFVIPVQLLSGFSVLISSSSVISPNGSSSIPCRELAFLFYTLYWCVGLPTGALVTGFAAERFSLPTLFKAVALIYMCMSFAIAFIILLWGEDRQNEDSHHSRISDNDSLLFLKDVLKQDAQPTEPTISLYNTVVEKIQD